MSRWSRNDDRISETQKLIDAQLKTNREVELRLEAIDRRLDQFDRRRQSEEWERRRHRWMP